MAGVRILAKCLADVPGLEITIAKADEPWTEGPDLIRKADGVVIFLSQGAKWMNDDPRRLQAFQELAARKGAIIGLHWGVGTREAKNIARFVELVGACHGGPDRQHKVVKTTLEPADPNHSIVRGIKPVKLKEELYYSLKVAQPVGSIKPILFADIDKSQETVSWAWDRPDGGRAFGFTGLHFHSGWKRPEYRRLVSQGVLWSLRLPIPKEGLAVKVSEADLRLTARAK